MTSDCKLLIAEDDPEDAMFLKDALSQNLFRGHMEHLTNGKMLMNRLSELKLVQTLPQMIVLDLNMPFMSGTEVMKDISSDPELRNIMIAVVTASVRKADERDCLELGCKLYLNKPVRYTEYNQVAVQILSLLRSRHSYC